MLNYSGSVIVTRDVTWCTPSGPKRRIDTPTTCEESGVVDDSLDIDDSSIDSIVPPGNSRFQFHDDVDANQTSVPEVNSKVVDAPSENPSES